ncbi:MAG: multidrug effflux MFS transporter [Actinobacteria bacterium]|nr:multidrug effflux MFS transporter [Actinomycetota bacterium]
MTLGTSVHAAGSGSPADARTTGPREFIALVTASMAMGAMAIDIMLPAFPDMRAEFGMAADSPRIGWIVTAFFLGLAAGPWLYGPASDRFGRRPLLLGGLCLYVAAGIACAFAPSFGWVIAARFVWGLGAAAPRSLSLAMIRDRYEGEGMARLMSMIMAVFLLVPILAPGFGAALNAVAPWRVVFWVPTIAAVGLIVWGWRRLPETLAVDRRRPFTFAALGGAVRVIASNRQTVCFTVAITFLFGVMTTYLAGSELIVEDVYDRGSWFPVFFGAIAVLLALSSLNNARLVRRLGITALVRRMAVIGVALAAVLVAVSVGAAGHPNFWLFSVSLAVVVPVAQGLVPNCNTAAMMPVPHVAGTASAVIGTITTAGGALLGGLITGAFDGTTRPISIGIFVFISIAAVAILLGTHGLTGADTRPGMGASSAADRSSRA